jgi:hypothetical protein
LQPSQQLVEVEDLETFCRQVLMVDLVQVDEQVNQAEPLAKLIIQIGKNMEARVLQVFLVQLVEVVVVLAKLATPTVLEMVEMA